jgi:hypothetical protein
MSEILLEMRNICKAFPGVHALKDVNLHVYKGEVHISPAHPRPTTANQLCLEARAHWTCSLTSYPFSLPLP